MKKYFLLILLPFSLIIQAQESSVSAGGQALGEQGTASYSVGQSFFMPVGNGKTTSSPGVQQTYKIIEQPIITSENLEFFLSPNPTSDHLLIQTNLTLVELKEKKLKYVLLNIGGAILRTGEISQNEKRISLANIESAVYILKIFSNKTILKTFQIIKTN